MDEPVIFHVDVNSAFLSWEAKRRLEEEPGAADLRTVPSAVGGDITTRHGVILAKSMPAKKFKVKTGEPITQAMKKCPGLVIVPPDHTLYKKNSEMFINLLKEYSPVVEQYSIDEAFVDMTGCIRSDMGAEKTAYVMKDRIREELGFTVNIGISSNKLLAKMAGDFEKPDKVHTLFPNEIKEKMWPLPVGELLFVGGSTEKKLNSIGIHTIGELACMDVRLLKLHLKKHGEMIWKFANGEDFSIVDPVRADNKGYGNSTTLPLDITDEDTARLVLLSLAEKVSGRLRKDGKKAGQISVVIRDCNLKRVSHQCILLRTTNSAAEIHENACRLFSEKWDKTPVRLLGISAGHLVESNAMEQLSLFDFEKDEKKEKADQMMDLIREKFGKDSVKRASLLKKEEKKQDM